MREHERSGTEVFDGLRGFAILWVLAYHTWLFSWFTPYLKVFGHDVPVSVIPRVGYLGVELFFLISGFCLFIPDARAAIIGTSSLGLRAFAWRRAVKIVPSYALALGVTIAFALEYLHGTHDVWPALLKHATFVQNFYDDAFGKANSVFWSLAIEVQFYLVFPALAWTFRRAPLPTATAMIAGAVLYRLWFAGCCLEDEVIMRQLPAYLDVFACGMSAAYIVTWLHARYPTPQRARVTATFVTLGLAAAIFGLLQTCDAVQYTLHGRARWDLFGRTELAALMGAFAVASCFAVRLWRAIVANPVLVFLSIVSYNMYLWHTLILIWLWKHDVPRAATPNPHDDDHWKFAYIAVGWALVLAVSTAVTYFIERPLLATIKPHTFAFDWKRVLRSRVTATPVPLATRETRT
ncbi:MAG: acyltransferase [Candidatus Eremiobacteraeota bacterium]|nr:acyltransferase [Candidatus Eremiobacteraeota bacterium]MBC5801963.1 acyltransferase [Candidatus Eremiobacteraeota bacterium]MBC5821883.1 acyltransferase [Candidatus Eremiobacteraeota bacterium]